MQKVLNQYYPPFIVIKNYRNTLTSAVTLYSSINIYLFMILYLDFFNDTKNDYIKGNFIYSKLGLLTQNDKVELKNFLHYRLKKYQNSLAKVISYKINEYNQRQDSQPINKQLIKDVICKRVNALKQFYQQNQELYQIHPTHKKYIQQFVQKCKNIQLNLQYISIKAVKNKNNVLEKPLITSKINELNPHYQNQFEKQQLFEQQLILIEGKKSIKLNLNNIQYKKGSILSTKENKKQKINILQDIVNIYQGQASQKQYLTKKQSLKLQAVNKQEKKSINNENRFNNVQLPYEVLQRFFKKAKFLFNRK